MKELYTVYGYWNGKYKANSKDILLFFDILQNIDPLFERWLFKLNELPTEDNIRTVTPTSLEIQLQEKLNSDSSFLSIGYWTRLKQNHDITASLSIHLTPTENSISITLPNPDQSYSTDLIQKSKVLEIMKGIHQVWNADKVMTTSKAMQHLCRNEFPDLNRYIGWLNIIPINLKFIPMLPKNVETIFLDESHSIIITTEEPITIQNPQHIILMKDVLETFQKTKFITSQND